MQPLPDAFGHCNVAAPSFLGNKFTNRPSNSVKCRNSGVPIVRFFFEIPLGLIGTRQRLLVVLGKKKVVYSHLS